MNLEEPATSACALWDMVVLIVRWKLTRAPRILAEMVPLAPAPVTASAASAALVLEAIAAKSTSTTALESYASTEALA